MATTVTTVVTATLYNQGNVWATVHDAASAHHVYESPPAEYFVNGLAYQAGPPVIYQVWRGLCIFDLSEIPSDSVITAATLKLYGHTDTSVDDFDITVVEGPDTGGAAPETTDYNDFQTTSFGTFNTAGFDDAGWNNITINAAGLAFLNQKIQTDYAHLGVRNGNDISDTAPTNYEIIAIWGRDDPSKDPELVLTISAWPDFTYPTVPVFPTVGKIDLATYGAIKHYLESLDDDLSLIADGDGNLDIGTSYWITWTGTSEKIEYDSGTSHVNFTTLESTSGVTVDCDFNVADPTVTTTCTAVTSVVANDANLSDTAFASVQAQYSDQLPRWEETGSAPSPADDEGDIYLEDTTGDLILKTRDDGQAGTKTAILADFSAM